jgi:BirA family biotin operon repressor/biotin-[acetyl-CoA-carboxylase] ligase
VTAWRIEHHAALDSTHAEALRRAAEGAADGLAIIAARQSAGRGRDGRSWESPAGNLYLSALLRPDAPARHAPHYALMAAVALHAAVAELAPPDAPLRLKWPNDVLLGGAKLAGILTESAAGPDGRMAWLAIGLGVNLAHAPALPGRVTASLGPDAPAPGAFAPILLRQLGLWRAVLEGQGLAPVRAAWMERGPAQGESLTLREGPVGLYRGLSESGALLLEVEGQVQVRHSGEVV